MIPTCDLTKLIECHIEVIHKTLLEGCRDFMPTLLVEHIDPLVDENAKHLDVIGIGVDFNETEQKHAMMEMLGAKYYKEQHVPLGIAFASEAWISNTLHCMPRDADDRREVIVLAAKSIGGECIMENMPITRDRNKNIIEAAFVRVDCKADMYLLDHFYVGFFNGYKEFEARK